MKIIDLDLINTGIYPGISQFYSRMTLNIDKIYNQSGLKVLWTSTNLNLATEAKTCPIYSTSLSENNSVLSISAMMYLEISTFSISIKQIFGLMSRNSQSLS